MKQRVESLGRGGTHRATTQAGPAKVRAGVSGDLLPKARYRGNRFAHKNSMMCSFLLMIDERGYPRPIVLDPNPLKRGRVGLCLREVPRFRSVYPRGVPHRKTVQGKPTSAGCQLPHSKATVVMCHVWRESRFARVATPVQLL